jgi:hypothetical protein
MALISTTTRTVFLFDRATLNSKAVRDAFLKDHKDLLFGSKKAKEKRAQQVWAIIQVAPAEAKLISNTLYATLGEIDLDDPKNQLILLNLIEHNPSVRDFFLSDIFGNDVDPEKNKEVSLRPDEKTEISFTDLSDDILRAYLGIAAFDAYKANPKNWMRDNSKKVEETLTEIGTSGATFISEMAKVSFLKKLLDIDFAYSFFTRWNIPQETAKLNANALRRIMLSNPGAAFAILNNPLLAKSVKFKLTANDWTILLQNAAAQITHPKRKHYFRETLSRLPIKERNPENIEVAKLLANSPDPAELLLELDILAKKDPQIHALMRNTVIELITLFKAEPSESLAKILGTLFNTHHLIVTQLNIDEDSLRMLWDNDQFVEQNNPEAWARSPRNPRSKHYVRAFFNKHLGTAKDYFARKDQKRREMLILKYRTILPEKVVTTATTKAFDTQIISTLSAVVEHDPVVVTTRTTKAFDSQTISTVSAVAEKDLEIVRVKTTKAFDAEITSAVSAILEKDTEVVTAKITKAFDSEITSALSAVIEKDPEIVNVKITKAFDSEITSAVSAVVEQDDEVVTSRTTKAFDSQTTSAVSAVIEQDDEVVTARTTKAFDTEITSALSAVVEQDDEIVTTRTTKAFDTETTSAVSAVENTTIKSLLQEQQKHLILK